MAKYFETFPNRLYDINGDGNQKLVKDIFRRMKVRDGIKNNYLHELSRCVCNSVDVDYGGGDFQSFRQFDDEGAAPVEITLTLSFTETTLLTKQEIVDNY